MALSWSARRKFLYTTVAALIALVVLYALYQALFTAAPTCFDGKQNGTETGVDCGGSCSLVCSNTVHAPVVSWARAFQTGSQTYTAAAYVQNPNHGVGAKNVPYSFQLFDANNQLVIEEQGTLDIPPVEVVPVVAPNINVGNRTVARALFAFGGAPVWHTVAQNAVVPLTVTNQELAPDASRLSAMVANSTQQDARDVTVLAVLFDASGNAQAASKSTLGDVPRKSQQQVVFTWPQGVAGIVRAEITVLPSF